MYVYVIAEAGKTLEVQMKMRRQKLRSDSVTFMLYLRYIYVIFMLYLCCIHVDVMTKNVQIERRRQKLRSDVAAAVKVLSFI